MHLPPKPYIDLTGHLGSLKSSLTPESKHFESSPPLWQVAQRSDPAQPFLTATAIWFLVTAAGVAIVCLFS